MGKQGRTWKDLMVLFLIPCESLGLANKATQALSSKQSKTSPLPGPLQSSLQSYNLCGSTWNEYKSLSLFHYHLLTSRTYNQLNEDF